MESLYVVILAGGKGERFWPLSTSENPKPFLCFFSERSLLQQTFDRARRLVPEDHIFLIVGEQHERLCRQQLSEFSASRILLEPMGRDTAAAIGYASLHLPADALMLVLPADHLIPDHSAFADTILNAAAFIERHGGPATFGIKPTRPETNYGYIKALRKNMGQTAFPVYSVQQFIEKPDRKRAAKLTKSPSYYWNSGMFLWKVSRIQDLIAEHLPELWAGLKQVYAEKDGTAFRQFYGRLPRISIDYGVMEKAKNVVVIPSMFVWDDIGTWNSLFRILPLNEERNLIWGNHIGMDTSDCILYAESHTIATAGIRDLVVVQKGNQTLICTREYANRLKELLAKLSV